MAATTPTTTSEATTATPGPTTVASGDVGDGLFGPLGEIFWAVEGALPQVVEQVLLTALVVVLAVAASRLIVGILGRRISQYFRRPSLTRTAIRGVRTLVFVAAFLVILGIWGYGLGNLVLSVTVFTAVLGVVLAPIVGSVINGVFLLADQPYEIGDMIELQDTGKRGFVEDITLRYTKMFTLDNTFLVVPNGEMRKRDVINYSAEDTRTRQTLDVIVTYEGDLARAREIVEQSARAVDGVIEGGPSIRVGAARYPAGPTCYIDTFGDHGVHLRLRYWLEEPYKLLAARSKIQTEVWARIEDADVEIAYPHSHVVFDETSGELPVSLDDRSGRPGRPGDGDVETRDPTTDGSP